LTKGTHSLKFGFAFERMFLNFLADTDPNGIWQFPGVKEFLTNSPKRFQGGVANTLTPRNLRQNVLGFYFQDDWRARPNLTLNLGLRYETSTVPEKHPVSSPTSQPVGCSAICAAVPSTGGCAGKGQFFSNPTLRNLSRV